LDKFGPSDESENPHLITVFSSQPLDRSEGLKWGHSEFEKVLT